MAHRGSRGIILLFLEHGNRSRWGVSVTPRPLFTPANHCRGGWLGPRAGLDKCGKSRPPPRFRSPDRPALSHSLYRLSYPAHSCSSSYLELPGFHCVVRNLATLFQLRVSHAVGLECANFVKCEYIQIIRGLWRCICQNKLGKVNTICSAISGGFAVLLPADFQLLNDIDWSSATKMQYSNECEYCKYLSALPDSSDVTAGRVVKCNCRHNWMEYQFQHMLNNILMQFILISQIYFWNRTLHVSANSSVHHQEFFTVQRAMVYVI